MNFDINMLSNLMSMMKNANNTQTTQSNQNGNKFANNCPNGQGQNDNNNSQHDTNYVNFFTNSNANESKSQQKQGNNFANLFNPSILASLMPLLAGNNANMGKDLSSLLTIVSGLSNASKGANIFQNLAQSFVNNSFKQNQDNNQWQNNATNTTDCVENETNTSNVSTNNSNSKTTKSPFSKIHFAGDEVIYTMHILERLNTYLKSKQ